MRRATVTQDDPERLVVHTRREVVIVPLTGDDALDAMLERVARRGGCVIRERAAAER